MHLFNSPVSLMTQTNWHEPCHLGTHCPSDENGCGTALEAPRSLCLRAEKIKRDTCIPESVHLKKSQVISSINFYDKPCHERPWEIVLNRPKWPQLPLCCVSSYCHWCLPLGAMNKPILITMLIHAFDIHENHLTESTFQVSSNDNSEYQLRLEMQSQQPSGAFWTAALLSFSEASEVATIEEPLAANLSFQDIAWLLISIWLVPQKSTRTGDCERAQKSLKMMVKRERTPFEMLTFYMLNFRDAYIWPHLCTVKCMHLFNSPVSLTTQTNWHEPCHLGTHCPSEAPRPLYLRAEKIKRDTWIPESDRIFASEKITGDIIHQFLWQAMPWKAMRDCSQSSKMAAHRSAQGHLQNPWQVLPPSF